MTHDQAKAPISTRTSKSGHEQLPEARDDLVLSDKNAAKLLLWQLNLPSGRRQRPVGGEACGAGDDDVQ